MSLTACSATESRESIAKSDDFRALGRYVTKTNVFWDSRDYFESMADGTFEFDDVVRQPHVPAGPIKIDCRNSHRVGAILVLYGYSEPKHGTRIPQIELHSKKIRVFYKWSHTGNPGVTGRYVTFVHPLPNGIISSGLTLTRKDRADGLLRLNVVHKDQTVYETSFKLSNCEEPDETS